MHTYRHNKATFVCNSDLSGDVQVINEHGESIEVDGESLVRFVAEYVRTEAIAKIEQTDPIDFILGGV